MMMLHPRACVHGAHQHIMAAGLRCRGGASALCSPSPNARQQWGQAYVVTINLSYPIQAGCPPSRCASLAPHKPRQQRQLDAHRGVNAYALTLPVTCGAVAKGGTSALQLQPKPDRPQVTSQPGYCPTEAASFTPGVKSDSSAWAS